MKVETDWVLGSRQLFGRPAAQAGWRSALPAIAAAIAAILLIYWDTAKSIVAIWGSSETFAHGYLIVPITLVLIWMKRRELARLCPAPDYMGFALLALAGLAWLVAAAGQVQVLQQYAMTAMIPAAVLALAGRRVARALAFPLAFLLFAVPFGEAFIPRLMDWTADFTVVALRLTGIPVYREGNFFAIPSGHWSVVEACSGLRYLIASVTVGALYAYLTYRRFWKRAVFLGLAIAVPIVANFLRAYMIVMIGHLSSMRLAVGVDHFIYGWVFFGIVILLLFWLGSFWRDPAPGVSDKFDAAPPGLRISTAAMAGAAVGVAVLAAAWPLYAAYLERPGSEQAAPVLAQPGGVSGWSPDPKPLTDWRPNYGGAAASVFEVYRKGDQAVILYVGYYRDQRQGAELVNSQNVVAGSSRSPWANVGEAARVEDLGRRGAVELRQTRLRSGAQRLLVWDWYRIAGSDLSNPYLGKVLLARDKLLGRGDDSAAIILAAAYDARPDTAAETLRQFAREMLPSVDAALAAAKPRRSE